MNTFGRRTLLNKSALSLSSIILGSGILASSCKSRKENFVAKLSGDIECSKLGTTLMHEHILIGDIPNHLQNATIDIAVRMLNEAAKAGVTTLVDVMPFDSYCNGPVGIAENLNEYDLKLKLYTAIAAQTKVNIIFNQIKYESKYEDITGKIAGGNPETSGQAKKEIWFSKVITEIITPGKRPKKYWG
jgi:hypothetical protein